MLCGLGQTWSLSEHLVSAHLARVPGGTEGGRVRAPTRGSVTASSAWQLRWGPSVFRGSISRGCLGGGQSASARFSLVMVLTPGQWPGLSRSPWVFPVPGCVSQEVPLGPESGWALGWNILQTLSEDRTICTLCWTGAPGVAGDTWKCSRVRGEGCRNGQLHVLPSLAWGQGQGGQAAAARGRHTGHGPVASWKCGLCCRLGSRLH